MEPGIRTTQTAHAIHTDQAGGLRAETTRVSDNRRKGLKWGDQRNFYARVFRPAVIAAKLDGDGVGWHTLRHTFASRLAMSGQTEGTIAILLRHSTNTLVRRYAHLSPSYLHAAGETVAAYGKPTAKIEPICNGTGTKTGKEDEGLERNSTEVVENVGAGDGI